MTEIKSVRKSVSRFSIESVINKYSSPAWSHLGAMEKLVGPALRSQEALVGLNTASAAMAMSSPTTMLSTVIEGMKPLKASGIFSESMAAATAVWPTSTAKTLFELGRTHQLLAQPVTTAFTTMRSSENLGCMSAVKSVTGYSPLKGLLDPITSVRSPTFDLFRSLGPCSVVSDMGFCPRTPQLPVFATLRLHDKAPREEVTVSVRCGFCDGYLVARATQEGTEVDVRAAPICATCLQRASMDPSYLLTQLELFERDFRVLDGEATGDGVPRARLWLIKDDE